jgi:hypothetical protein
VSLRRPSILFLIWLVIGILMAVRYDYLNSLGTAGRIITAVVAIVLWPLLLFGFDIRISR